MNPYKKINTLERNVYDKLLHGELTGLGGFFRKHDPVGFFTNTTASIDAILGHPDFTEERMLERAHGMYFRGVKEEQRLILMKILRDGLSDINNIDNKTLIRYIATCKRILGLPILSKDFGSDEIHIPLGLFQATMGKWLTEIAVKFEKLISTHESYIIIRKGFDSFQNEKNSIGRFIKTSKEEIQELLGNIHNLARRPYALYKICERIEREYNYIKEERDDLRSKIAIAVKTNKQIPVAQSSLPNEVTDSNNGLSEYNSEIDIASREIQTLMVRVGNIRKKRGGKIIRYLQGEQDPTEELEKIQERANILSRKYGELEDITRYIRDEIDEYYGISSAKIETLVADSVVSTIDNKPILKISSEGTEQDFFAGKIIHEYILYLGAIGSSTNATKENSLGDGRTFNQIIVPFLRFCINNLKTGKIQAKNFSIGSAFQVFQEGMSQNNGNSKRSLQVYEEFFLSKNTNGSFLETFPEIIDTLIEIGKIIEKGKTEINGCGILIKRSKDFFQSNEWKSLGNKYQKYKH